MGSQDSKDSKPLTITINFRSVTAAVRFANRFHGIPLQEWERMLCDSQGVRGFAETPTCGTPAGFQTRPPGRFSPRVSLAQCLSGILPQNRELVFPLSVRLSPVQGLVALVQDWKNTCDEESTSAETNGVFFGNKRFLSRGPPE